MCTRFFDVVNAFYTVNKYSIDDWHDNIGFAWGPQTSRIMIDNAMTMVNCADGDMLLSLGSGVTPGLTNATNIFNYYYAVVIEKYIETPRPSQICYKPVVPSMIHL